jgi:hypothetical protein
MEHMKRTNLRRLTIVVGVLTVISTMGIAPVMAAEGRPHVGPVIMGPDFGDWNEIIRPLFRAGSFDLAKVHIPPAFHTEPRHVEDLIADGARVIMLKTEDCKPFPETVRQHLVDRGFLDLIDRYPDVRFVLQVGNEPEHCQGLAMDTYLDGLVDIAATLRPELDRPNLEWVAGLPMSPDEARKAIEAGDIPAHYDGVGSNMLVHFSLLDEYHNWHEILDYVIHETDLAIWLTEVGINHPPMDKAIKAQRIMDFIEELPAGRVHGLAVFLLGKGTNWPQYELSERMMPILAERPHCHYFLATDQWLCYGFKAYWEQYGGLMVFGYPITGEFRDANGQNVQYFERARFEWHPGAWPEQHDVLLGLLGNEMTVDRRHEAPFRPAEPDGTCDYFSRSGHNLCGEFRDYWRAFGGLPIYGYPISEAFIEPETGLLTQYFERTRFEHHPGVMPQRFDVLQGLLGVEQVGWRK